MKKLLTITVLMALAMSGMAQILNYDFSAECETGQTLYYRISSEEEHTVTLTFPYSTENPWFEGNYYQYHVMPQGELILPSTVTNNGINYYVTVIDNYAFCNCEELIGTLAIPEGIVSIGESAFFSCGFSSFVIPRTINFIDPSAFRFCSNRDSVIVDDNNPTYYSENNAIIKRNENTLVLACNTTTIPEYIENIGNYAFSGVGNGGDLIIPNSVKSIGERAFESCHFLGSLILSESLETIGYEAFRGSGLTGSLTIPNSVTELGAGAFLDVSFTGTLTLPSSISSIKGHTFAYTSFSGTLTIPNSVTQIGSMAFYGADFSELVLGSSVDTIGFGAFEDCSSLSGTLHLPSSINSIGIGAFRHTAFSELYSHNIVPPTLFNSSTFEGYDTNTPIHIPFGCTEAYQNAAGWNYFTNFIEASAPVVPDLYTIGYKDNNSATRTAKLYKNNALLHSIRVTGKQVTPYKIANDSEGNIYWMVVYSANSSTLQTEIWKNDELYLSTEGHNGVTIKDIYCLGDTLFYVGNTTTEEGIKVATVWTGNDFTPHWVLGDGQHDSFIYDADVDKNTNIPYFCGYITDTLKKASVWKASQLLYKQEPSGVQRASWASEISIDNGSIFTNGYLNYDNGFEIISIPTIWKDNERISNFSEPEFINCLYAYQDDYYFTFYYPHGMYYGVFKNGHELLQLSLNQNIQHIYGGFDDIYMVGKSDNKGSIWKNFELLSQLDGCDVIIDILAVEATDVNTTFDEPTDNGYAVYPNPTNGVLFVETLQAMSLPAKTEYRITNLMGQSLLQGHITAEKQQINIDNLPAGLYFITIAGETQKFVIE